MEDCKKMEDDFKKIDDFINITLIEATSSKTSLNIYGDTDENAEIKRENLRFYLKKMRTLNPSRLFVGEAPGINGCFWTGIPFTDIEILISHDFFQERISKFICRRKIERCEIEELESFIVDYCEKKEDEIEKIFKNNSIEKGKEELENSISKYCENEEIKKRVALASSIINSYRLKEVKFDIGKIKERVKLACSVIDSYKEEESTINDISEPTSSTVWERLNQLYEKELNLPLLWNIYPFQPWKWDGEEKKNRTPKKDEIKVGLELLFDLIKCFNIKEIYPVGKEAKKALEKEFPMVLKTESTVVRIPYIRHPAHGGSEGFKKQFNEIYQIKNTKLKPTNQENKKSKKNQKPDDSDK
ncbi:MAG: hypothetical protein IJU47_02330 [Verrucomicrobia bacterium]|nr:hypothetical protein [Verrucomicrobiota bacterium]